jgi:hypothetical protein
MACSRNTIVWLPLHALMADGVVGTNDPNALLQQNDPSIDDSHRRFFPFMPA